MKRPAAIGGGRNPRICTALALLGLMASAPVLPRADDAGSAGRSDGGTPDPDAEVIQHLDELENLDLLENMELFEPDRGDGSGDASGGKAGPQP